MAERIKLVQGDTGPFITFTLTYSDGTVLDASGSTVRVHFRAAGSDTVLSTLACAPLTDGSDGKYQFNFPGNTLNVPAGAYEGEIEIVFDASNRQTIYDVLKFTVRQQFA